MGDLAGLPYPEENPGTLATAADRLRGLGRGVAGEASSVGRAARTPSWEGPAAVVFAAAAGQIVRRLTSGADALGAAASAVDRLAGALKDAQRQIKRWADEIEDAEAELAGAGRALSSAQVGFNVQEGIGLRGAGDPYLVRVAEAMGDVRAKQARVDTLRARYTPKATALVEAVREKDRSVASAVMAAAKAAPAGGATVPGAPGVPADVRLYSPVLSFGPGEAWLPTDPRLNSKVPEGMSFEEWMRGQGAGAPIFYRVRRQGDETVYEYWLYRRYNDIRKAGWLPGYNMHDHWDDFEGTAVIVRGGVPVRRGYSQHDGGCSVPFESAGSRTYAGEGSAALSPHAGSSDKNVGPLNELWGPRPGERTPSRNVVDSGRNLVRYDGSGIGREDLLNPSGGILPDNEDNRNKFVPGSKVWDRDCERPPPRE